MWLRSIVLPTLVLAALAIAAISRCPRRDQPVLALGLFLHLTGAHVLHQVTRSLYGGTDATYFFWLAQPVANQIAVHPLEGLKHAFEIIGTGHSNTFMIGTAALWLSLFDSEIGGFILLSFVAYTGKLALYRALCHLDPRVDSRSIAAAAMLVPSAVFWTSGFVKEAYAVGAVGIMFWGTTSAIRGRYLRAVLSLPAAVYLLAATKPYLLLPSVVSLVTAYVWWKRKDLRGRLTAKPARLLVGGAAVAITTVLAARALRLNDPSDVVRELAALQAHQRGGSAYGLPGVSFGDSWMSQLIKIPVAVFSTLFRPLPFEVSNPMVAIAVVETSVFSLLFVRMVLRSGVRKVFATTMTSPLLMASVAFFFLSAVIVGLATTNFGTLTRYRVPLIPFYGTWLIVTTQLVRAEERARKHLRQVFPGSRWRPRLRAAAPGASILSNKPPVGRLHS